MAAKEASIAIALGAFLRVQVVFLAKPVRYRTTMPLHAVVK